MIRGSQYLVAGVDEVGRGPLVGPVVSAAVILQSPIRGLKDSKKLTEKKRNELALQIKEKAYAYAYGRAEAWEVDSLNIHHATLLAMKRAVEALDVLPELVLVDGSFGPTIDIPFKTIVQGDGWISQISAASILAKVLRDAEMTALDAIHPGYGFAQHKGYPTKLHREALKRLGPCIAHRKSFALGC